VAKGTKYHIDVFIDKLTNSIVNTISGDSFQTDIQKVSSADLKTANKKNGWNFNWASEHKAKDRAVYKLTIQDNESIVQGLLSLTDFDDHVYVHLVESAPFNLGKKKLYEGVPGNLFAYACKLSYEKGNQGLVAFRSKTRLIDHYEATLGAVHVGAHQLIIFPSSATKLINRYFKI